MKKLKKIVSVLAPFSYTNARCGEYMNTLTVVEGN